MPQLPLHALWMLTLMFDFCRSYLSSFREPKMLGTLPPEILDAILAEVASSWQDDKVARRTLYNCSLTSRDTRSIAARHIFADITFFREHPSRDALNKFIARFEAFDEILHDNPSISPSVRKLRIDTRSFDNFPISAPTDHSATGPLPILPDCLPSILSRLPNVREFIFKMRGPPMPWTAFSPETSGALLSLIHSLTKIHVTCFVAFPAWALLACPNLKEITLQQVGVVGPTRSPYSRASPADIELTTRLSVLKTCISAPVVGYMTTYHPTMFSELKAFETFVHSHEEISAAATILRRASELETLDIRFLRDDLYTEAAPALFDLGGSPSLRKLTVNSCLDEGRMFPAALLTLLRPRGPTKPSIEIMDIAIEWEDVSHGTEQGCLRPNVEWSALDDILADEQYADLREIRFKLEFGMMWASAAYSRIEAGLRECVALLLPKVRASGKKLEFALEISQSWKTPF